MYCSKCNQYNHEGAAFCAFCGTPLTQQPAAAQTTAAPVYTPEMTNPGYQNPTWQPLQTPQPYQNNGYYTAQPAQPKKKFKKALPIVPAVLVCVVLVGLLVVNLIISASPQYQIIDGITNSLEEFEGSLESADTFHEIYEDLSECISDQELSAELLIQGEDEIDAHLFFDYSQPHQFVSVSGNVEADYRDYDFEVAANQQKLMLQFSRLNSNYYSIPLKNFGKEFSDSNLADLLRDQFTYFDDYTDVERTLEKISIDIFADTDFDAFRDEYDDFDDWVTNLDVKEVEYRIPHAGDVTVYRAIIDGNDLAEILAKYAKFRYEQILGEELTAQLDLEDMNRYSYSDLEDSTLIVYFGINDDDCLTAFYAYEDGCEDESIGFVLSGKRNIWDEVTFYESDSELGGFCINENDNGFVIEFFDTDRDGDRNVAMTAQCNEDEGQLILSAGYDEYVINFSREDGCSVLSFGDRDNDVRVKVKLSSFRRPEFPKGKEISLFDFTLEDFEDLGNDLSDLFD